MKLVDEARWKDLARYNEQGWYELATSDTADVPVRLFLSQRLFAQVEPTLYRQIVAATRFAGTRSVVITPDAHFGYGVPVGCVIATDRTEGAVALGPVGFDIGCGMVSARSSVPSEAATHDRRLAFNREVMRRVSLGVGGTSLALGALREKTLMQLVRGGAEAYERLYGARFDRTHTERQAFPVDETWEPPWGERGQPERGMNQLGSLGGGNHFIELQSGTPPDRPPWDLAAGELFVQIHTGSRGFGHGLATNYFDLARQERPELGASLDLGYFTPDSPLYKSYLNAVAAGANYAIINRLIVFEQVAAAFRKVFRSELELVYELSHNLVQAEPHPELGDVWVHRKGATRALPARHPLLRDTPFFADGHPVLIPGSNKDESYILRPLPQAQLSLFSMNHGAGRRMSRGEASRVLDQRHVDDSYRHAQILVNEDGRVPLDESGACYKPASEVIESIVGAGLGRVETRLWPLASLKGVEGGSRKERAQRRQRNKARDQERRDARRRKGHRRG